MRDLAHLNGYRQVHLEIQLYGEIGNSGNGIFMIPVKGVRLKVLASDGLGWDHVSVSPWFKKRTPSWEEMSTIRELFFDTDEVCMQLHVAAKDHISFHDHCLHLWRPQAEPIPLPASWMVA